MKRNHLGVKVEGESRRSVLTATGNILILLVQRESSEFGPDPKYDSSQEKGGYYKSDRPSPVTVNPQVLGIQDIGVGFKMFSTTIWALGRPALSRKFEENVT